MANKKAISPYIRLQEIARLWADSVLAPRKKEMFFYTLRALKGPNGWDLLEVYYRTRAAQNLGYHVELVATKEGLKMTYVKDPDPLPWELQ